MLVRYNIKNISSCHLEEIAENCGRATLVISPAVSNLWNVSVCLREEEIKQLKKLGFTYERVPG